MQAIRNAANRRRSRHASAPLVLRAPARIPSLEPGAGTVWIGLRLPALHTSSCSAYRRAWASPSRVRSGTLSYTEQLLVPGALPISSQSAFRPTPYRHHHPRDENHDAGGWAMTLSGMRGVLKDALSRDVLMP